jgi:exopolysaccharide biosynthesis protein
VRIKPPSEDSYEGSSMLERHPRSAIGWNGQYYFLVEVDGRQASLSVGMTLAELAACLARLGCEEAMNLDGGGSATLWFAGAVRNRPCDGHEREIANALLVVKQLPVTGVPAGAGAGANN